jgi:hypothetical protein
MNTRVKIFSTLDRYQIVKKLFIAEARNNAMLQLVILLGTNQTDLGIT